jgi:hypothetical protein
MRQASGVTRTLAGGNKGDLMQSCEQLTAPMSLTPIFRSCPTGYFSPCLEACRRDVTTCCYHRGTKQTPNERFFEKPKPGKPEAKCRVCGEDDPLNFYTGRISLSLCIDCEKAASKAKYAKKRALKEELGRYPITLPCRRCGIQFQKMKEEKHVACPECRAKAKSKH